jgi:hypothetical protein
MADNSLPVLVQSVRDNLSVNPIYREAFEAELHKLGETFADALQVISKDARKNLSPLQKTVGQTLRFTAHGARSVLGHKAVLITVGAFAVGATVGYVVWTNTRKKEKKPSLW